MIIDATNSILGRIASVAAQKASLGEHVDIINCESAVITGNRDSTFEKYNIRLERGTHVKGPFTYRRPDAFVKRAIRGMLPYKRETGLKAFKRIKCYIGVPEALKGKKAEHIKEADVSKLTIMKFVTVKDVCKLLGGKI